MSDSVKMSKVKDLDPKGKAQDVKGGCLCCVDVDRFTRTGLENGKDKVRKPSVPR